MTQQQRYCEAVDSKYYRYSDFQLTHKFKLGSPSRLTEQALSTAEENYHAQSSRNSTLCAESRQANHHTSNATQTWVNTLRQRFQRQPQRIYLIETQTTSVSKQDRKWLIKDYWWWWNQICICCPLIHECRRTWHNSADCQRCERIRKRHITELT